MPNLTDSQTSFLRGIFSAAPDAAVSSLEKALSVEADNPGPMASVYGLLAHEATERRTRCQVFGPLAALCRPSETRAVRFPSRTIAKLWNGLRAIHGAQTALAEGVLSRKENDPALFNELCAFAAAGLRSREAAFAPAIEILSATDPGAVDEFACYLDLVPITRDALDKLPDWIGRLTEERSAAARLAYKDAGALSDEAGPRFFEILYANVPDPWLILRVLSAVMDRPSDAYVAASELARFGDYLLEDIDRRLEAFAEFNPDGGREKGLAAGETIHVAALIIAEFETSIELNKEGPWGRRLIKQRQTMAGLAEARYNQIDKALDAATPLLAVRFGKGVRGFPRIDADPEPRFLLRAEGLLGFFDHSRGYASQCGFGAVRAKAGEKIEGRLDQYVEDLLDMLRAREIENLDRIRAYLDVAAELMEAVRGEKAARIIRRRAAA